MQRPLAHHVLEVDIRHSRFRADVAPASSADTALAFLETIREPEATHQAWAYRVGSVFRSFDAGEPGGTAGRPILSAIDMLDFDQVMVVVTRWYGGVKLSAGGLVRAYGGTAASCLRETASAPIVAMTRLRFHCPFSDLAIVQSRLAVWDATEDSCDFDATGAALTLALPTARADEIMDNLRDLTRGQVPIAREDD